MNSNKIITEDGFSISKETKVYGVAKDLSTLTCDAVFCEFYPELLFFFNEESRQQYIELHTPKYSTAEYQKIEQLAKSLYSLCIASYGSEFKHWDECQNIPKEWLIQS